MTDRTATSPPEEENADGAAPLPVGAPRWGLGDAAAGFLAAVVLSNLFVAVWLAARGAADVDLGGLAVGQVGLWGRAARRTPPRQPPQGRRPPHHRLRAPHPRR